MQMSPDDARAFQALKEIAHVNVKHSVNEYADGLARINGIESYWSLLQRGYYGTHCKMSPIHLQRYVNEFSGRHNARHLDAGEQMERTAKGLIGNNITYDRLTRKGKLDATTI